MAHLGKVGMSDEVIEMGNRVAAAMERLADELHTYNASNRDVFYTTVEYDEGKSIKIPASAGDYQVTRDGEIHHRYGGEEEHHHQSMAELLNCLSGRGIL